MNQFERVLAAHHMQLRRGAAEILQINVGKKCNQTCVHCHVNAGPSRREIMSEETARRVMEWLDKSSILCVDITGGAPELNPSFRWMVQNIRAQKRRVIDRCNLTILFEPGQANLAEFLAAHEVEIVASLPCYSIENVDAQRGDGVFEKSIRALQILNSLGYGRSEKLRLNLVYNPGGAFLPGPQAALENEYKTHLRAAFGIEFHALYALANVPVERFGAWLRRAGEFEKYQQLLLDAFNPAAVAGLMCRNTINVGWRGEVYDCDFNQMLNMQWRRRDAANAPVYLWDIDENIAGREIATGAHCFACTAGAGSSCGGALV